MKIVFPSDFKLRINKITDLDGSVIAPDEYPYMAFVFVDDFGGMHKCIYDPDGVKSTGTAMVDDVLYVTVEKYKLKGPLRYKIGTQEADETFNDGNWKWFGEFTSLLDSEGKIVEIIYA